MTQKVADQAVTTSKTIVQAGAIVTKVDKLVFITSSGTTSYSPGWEAVAPMVVSAGAEPFDLQKAAFQRIPELVLQAYVGRWVVSRDGEIADSDTELQRLSQRFFGDYGDIDVYIGFIGKKASALIRTPFIRQR